MLTKSLLMFCAVAGVANGFTTTTLQNHHRSEITTTSLNAEVESSRRAFMANAMTAATVMTIGVLPKPAFADDLGDLSMPSADEQAAQEAAMAEKLRRKAELQKQASKSMNFADSLKREQEFKDKMKSQTKEERRNALCEELGRGC